MSDQVIALLVQDNLEIACQAIEKAARERATLEVEEGFAAAFESRRRHREVSNLPKLPGRRCQMLTIG